VTGKDALAVLGLAHADAAQAIEPFGEAAGEARRHVLGDRDGG
jgi:hypothetical protein